MKRLVRSLLSLLLVLSLLLGCASVSLAEEQDKSVNIAVTGTLSTLNPLLIDATEVVKYATSLTFLSLVELNADLEFVPQLAESITTEDNQVFTITLREDAVWSDGTPITAKDVEFTFLLYTSPEAGSGAAIGQYMIEGTDDAGMMPSGATEISGVKVIDDRTVTLTTKWPAALYTIENVIGRYMFILPEHVLGSVPREELLTSDWFNHPDVISGPYFINDFDLNHYVHFVANENYFLGEPKIKYLNFNILESAQLLSGLQSGEIDLIQQTMGDILLDDYDTIKAMDNVTVYMGQPITNQSIFINVDNVPDVRIRQALLYGIDRETILNELVHGNGEIVDGFLCSASPFYSEELGVTAYDPEKAAALIAEAKADGASTDITWHVNSGDATMTQAVSFIAAMFEELGLNITIRTVDLANLMEVATNGEIDVMSVQYTYAPVDPYTDVDWLLSVDGWTHYGPDDVKEALQRTQTETDINQNIADYLLVNQAMQSDVAMISAYIISNMGVVNNRLVNATPDVFGTFINVHEWDIQ